jgi:AAA+ superfamily predicted ATPase
LDIQKEIDLYLRARHTLLCAITFEEERLVQEVLALCERSRRNLYLWDHADFFQRLFETERDNLANAKDPLTALDAISGFCGSGVFILRDFHQCWKNQPRVVRKLRSMAQSFKYTNKSMIITLPARDIPEELKDDAVCLRIPLPDFSDLVAILRALKAAPGVRIDLTRESGERVIRSALGLTSGQAQRVFAKAMVTDGVLDARDIDLINQEKKQFIQESGALEFYAPQAALTDVGGLESLKHWVDLREAAFSKEARDYGLPAPRGVALIGIPGTGKSLSAKVIAGRWRMPLLRLDIGALFGSLVGQSEENTRKALSLAETVSPCVLWIDELEKGLATGGGDGGTSMRVFGTILSWMQEKTAPVFVIATANNISLLPPELLRRGRFDEIFFLDLPTEIERRAIVAVHIRKRRRNCEDFDIDAIVDACAGYVGAEIEQAVIDAMYVAFNDARREPTTADVVAALRRLVPMSRSQKEQIAALRRWLQEGRAQSASFEESAQAQRAFVPIELEMP